jgi:hypothetical protein
MSLKCSGEMKRVANHFTLDCAQYHAIVERESARPPALSVIARLDRAIH